MKGYLAGTIDLAIVGTFAYLCIHIVQAGGKVDGESLFLGTLATLATTIVGFHRGSSQGSRDKDVTTSGSNGPGDGDAR